jgi:hypothetical protein
MGSTSVSVPAVALRSCGFCLLAAFGIVATAHAIPSPDPIRAWSCLLYASDTARRSDLPQRLAGYEPRLQRSFGFINYQLLAQHEISVEGVSETPLLSAGDIHILLSSLSATPDGGYVVRLLFVQGDKQEMETQFKVGEGSPLFIRGPEWRDGQIIIVVAISG